MNFKIEVTGDSFSGIGTTIQDAFKKLTGEAKDIVNEGLLAIETRAKVNAPVDTGRLRASIHNVPVGSKSDSYNYSDNKGKSYRGDIKAVKSSGGDGVGFVGTNVEYAAEQEFGGASKRGKMYLTRAVKEIEPKLKQALKSIKL